MPFRPGRMGAHKFPMQYDITVHRIVKEKKAANTFIEPHVHEFFHYIYALNGIAKVIIADHAFRAEKGMLFMIPPGRMHAIYGIDEFNSFDYKFTAGRELSLILSDIGYCIQHVDNYEDTLLKDIFNEAIMERNMSEHIINIHMLELIYRILRRRREGLYMKRIDGVIDHSFNASHDVHKGNIRMVLDYIDKNIGENLRVSQLAGICGYCENYFSTIFKECVGCSPNRYINAKKIEMAKELMFSTNLNITQISGKLGFETVHYFSRLFKKILGVPPKAYLNNASINVVFNIKKTVHTPVTQYEIPIKTLKKD
jgi:AraC-like DNA-binding protein